MTLSERHIKAYNDDVPAEPAPHKDRFASQVSMGLSITIPENSYLVLYPFTDRGRTPFNISTHMRKELPLEERPENIVKGAERVEIHDTGGDVVMFEGSAIWHVRHNASNARNLYLKLNDFNSDPLGEDPSTDRRREETMKLVQNGNGQLVTAKPVLARRFESVTEQYSRLWDHTRVAEVWDCAAGAARGRRPEGPPEPQRPVRAGHRRAGCRRRRQPRPGAGGRQAARRARRARPDLVAHGSSRTR